MKELLRRDGHIHTPFCPHGSKDCFEDYIEEAIRLGRMEISFTEHFPLPAHIVDEDFARRCALQKEVVPEYIAKVREMQKQYKGRLKINLGFEVDYIDGREEEIKRDLAQYGSVIEDSLLSVHFVKWQDSYYAVDGLDGFETLLKEIGSVEGIYEHYYKTLLKAINCDLGPYKPKRIGHPTLVRIFNQKYPTNYENLALYNEILDAMKSQGISIDLNVAGLRKPYCKETYPSGTFLKLAIEKGIPLVAGSDSHEVSQLALIDKLEERI